MPHASEDPNSYPAGSAIRAYLQAQAAREEARATQEKDHPGVPAPLPVIPAALLKAATHERWGPKTGADTDSQALRAVNAEEKSIAVLRGLPYPAGLPPNGRAPAEQHVYRVTTTLSAYKAESDGDYHLVLGDEAASQTVIGEIPKHGDFGAGGSYFADEIDAARQAMDVHFKLQEQIDAPTEGEPMIDFAPGGNIPVVVTGLCFFDFKHQQRGVAPNAVELHPVVGIEFPPG
jgi:hypothetical protein